MRPQKSLSSDSLSYLNQIKLEKIEDILILPKFPTFVPWPALLFQIMIAIHRNIIC